MRIILDVGVDLDGINNAGKKSIPAVPPHVQVRRAIFICNKYEKQFDSDATNCDHINSFCSTCYMSKLLV